jgi:hypothetical protein
MLNKKYHVKVQWNHSVFLSLLVSITFMFAWKHQTELFFICAFLLLAIQDRIIHTVYVITLVSVIIKQGYFSKEKVIELESIREFDPNVKMKIFGVAYTYIKIVSGKKIYYLRPMEMKEFTDQMKEVLE